MHQRSIPDDADPQSAKNSAPLRCEPLLARINPMLKGRHTMPSIACSIECAGSSSKLTLDPPFFTRMVAEAGLSLPHKRSFLAELASLDVAWLGESLDPIDTKQLQLKNDVAQKRIASIHVDQPVDIQAIRFSAAIELQMFGVPFETMHNSRRSRWMPSLPIEISEFEQLAKKIDLLRNLTGGNCPIGAAITPGAVYEDLRFLIDSGIDFITLLCQIQFGMSASNCISLAPLECTVELAVKALKDSGSRAKLLVSANLLDGQQMFRCLQMGTSAVCIDAFLAHSKPKEAAPAKDTFGSVLSAYVPAISSSAFAWLPHATLPLISELNDCALYAGGLSR